MTWNMTRNTENVKNEKYTLQELEYGKKTNKEENCEKHLVGPGLQRENLKMKKMRQKHCLTWNMVRNTENGRK